MVEEKKEPLAEQEKLTEMLQSEGVIEEQPGEVEERPLSEEEIHERKLNVLVECIRLMGKYKRPITVTMLAGEFELDVLETEALLAEAQSRPENQDIYVYEGQKERYFYTYPLLAHNYVRSIALSEEHDIRRTVAELVRYDSKTYPRPTRASDFAKEPYGFSLSEVQAAVRDLQQDPANADIQVYTSSHGTFYIYSTRSELTPAYARALAESSEDMSLLY